MTFAPIQRDRHFNAMAEPMADPLSTFPNSAFTDEKDDPDNYEPEPSLTNHEPDTDYKDNDDGQGVGFCLLLWAVGTVMDSASKR